MKITFLVGLATILVCGGTVIGIECLADYLAKKYPFFKSEGGE